MLFAYLPPPSVGRLEQALRDALLDPQCAALLPLRDELLRLDGDGDDRVMQSLQLDGGLEAELLDRIV